MPHPRLRARVAAALVAASGSTALVAVGVPALTSTASAADRAGTAAPAAVANPTVSTPPAGSHGFPFLSEAEDLGAKGYVEQEFFLAGTATTYNKSGTYTKDGKWAVTPGSKAAYKTRILVHRPSDPAKFNGTVLVEWLNVSGQVDANPDWVAAHDEIERGGYAWVGVSAQKVGITSTSAATPGMKKWDPDRYGTLVHPGDPYSYDIFSQAAQALRTPNGPNPLGDLKPTKLIADGDSQSAMRLTTYVNAVQPVAKEFDGFLIHSNMATPAPLNGNIFAGLPSPSLIRTDLTVPTFVVLTETDLPLHVAARQPDSASVHTWEIAGTSHADRWLLDNIGPTMLKAYGPDVPLNQDCGADTPPVNDGPGHYAMDAALAALNGWIRGGPAPAAGTVLTMNGNKVSHDQTTGLALGGIRLPDVSVPTRTLTGARQASGLAALTCGLFGATDPWNGDKDAWDKHDAGDPSNPVAPSTPEPNLATLYPTHADYVGKVTAAAQAAQASGFLTPSDAAAIIAKAQGSTIGG